MLKILHLTGFEPVTFLRKRIMSPVPSTTRPQMLIVFGTGGI